MIMNEPRFWEYLIFDDDCNITGIKSDTPKEIKAEYELWLEEQEKNWKTGIKINPYNRLKGICEEILASAFKYLNKHYIKRKGGTKSLHGTENKRLCKIPQVRKGFGD